MLTEVIVGEQTGDKALAVALESGFPVLFRQTRVASARLIVHFVETMTGIRAVKAFRKAGSSWGWRSRY